MAFSDPPYINQYGTMLNQVSMANNSLRCDCHLRWIQHWLDFFSRHHGREAMNRRRRRLADSRCSMGNEDAQRSISVVELDFGPRGLQCDVTSREHFEVSVARKADVNLWGARLVHERWAIGVLCIYVYVFISPFLM